MNKELVGVRSAAISQQAFAYSGENDRGFRHMVRNV